METSEIYVVTVQRFFNGRDGYHYQMAENRPVVALYTDFASAKDMALQCTQYYTTDQANRYRLKKYARCIDYEAAFAVVENETPVCVYTIRKHSIIS